MVSKGAERSTSTQAPTIHKQRCDTSQAGSNRDRPCSSPGGLSSTTPDHSEPKQPGNIQDLLEYRLDKSSRPKNRSTATKSGSANESILTKKDVKTILSGAPHFLLEKGKHGRWYPQVIFPWDEQNPVVQHLWDRKPLPHASFTLSTLHAHLPVPDDWAVKGGVPIQLYDWRRTDATNRATFDVGVFEVPNMLSNNGKEPGTVGFRHFLELSVADAVRYTGPEEPRQSPYLQRVATLPATEAFDLMEGYNKPYSQCQSGAVYDRHQLIGGGPQAWKRIGVRDISLQVLVQRLNHLRQFRQDMLREGSTKTILDIETPHQLHDSLHSRFLHPHPPPADILAGHPHSIKSQIKTLGIVLNTPGAWIDFSTPDWRFRAGQVLWEASFEGDGDCPEPGSSGGRSPQENLIKSGMERKWLMIQMLLSAELLLRLDAFVRVGMLHDPHGGHITIQELSQFDKLREGKVNWDLIVVRRFLDSLDITCASSQSKVPPDASRSPASPNKVPEKARYFSFMETLTRHKSSQAVTLQSAWDCQLSSSHARQQLEGLYVFAENIGWPNLDGLKATLNFKLGDAENPVLPALVVDDRGVESISSGTSLAKKDMYTRNPCRQRVKLHSSGDPQSKSLGWISRTWLSGFVIPGEAISHLLMATILENDVDALGQLGPIANLHGGFVFGGRTWWSKACIVGRVLSSASGAKTCMGWISSNILPRDKNTQEMLECGWFDLTAEQVPQISCKPRIKQGAKLAMESSPLGEGDITAEAFMLPQEEAELRTTSTCQVKLVDLSVNRASSPCDNGKTLIPVNETSLSFTIDEEGGTTAVLFALKYNVRFISAHECRVPLGVASRSHVDRKQVEAEEPTQPPDSKWTRLPSHPLHRSYSYKYVPLACLPNTSAPQAPRSSLVKDPSTPEIIIIDARGDQARETFVRAWCASVGCHAIISRYGRACIACCIRQARALNVPVVVRVSD
ncbi:uncharacterized protein N7511_011207 [Penicillium nucicola]|uniref:uncharacterized protein n=1 Tax=Penicillium nucicola TaxID=1850975 RepID=UPI002544FA52|nr:uncharacterized protein N7511_011207 [Penicillium nucicola]KAJ5742806.1 hypothetical protein N7511_011207 [Penicillium nucicola]